MQWQMHAGWNAEQQQWEDFGHPQYVRAFGHAKAMPVILEESPDGEYWGWLANGADSPAMVYRHETLFRVCFPYGAESEERAGRGRVVHLSVQPVV